MNTTVELLQKIAHDHSAFQLLQLIVDRFHTKVSLASSMSAEDQVITDMLYRIGSPVNIFTLDTGRLPEETHETIAATNKKYDIHIEILFPDRQELQELVNNNGPNLFYDSVQARRQCCHVRKVLPLQRKLATLDAWITGIRRGQAVTRQTTERIEYDQANDILKINPLAHWTDDQVWEYIRKHNVPYNRLHDQGYPSIGCHPCTRAVNADQDIRAGRWWWEEPEHKECGLHVVNGQLVRARR